MTAAAYRFSPTTARCRWSAPPDGALFYEVWGTDAMPAPIGAASPDPTIDVLTVPPPNGTKIRINEFPPGVVSPVHRCLAGVSRRVSRRAASPAPGRRQAEAFGRAPTSPAGGRR
jgi:hypothetical protein